MHAFVWFAVLVSANKRIWTQHSLKGHVCMHTYIQRVHLVLTDPMTHLDLLECEEPPLAQRNLQVAVVRVLVADPRRCSRSCQSASAVLHGWERQDSRADFSVFSYTGEGSACQHTSARWHLKAVDFLFITARRLFFFFFLFLVLCVRRLRTACYQRRQIKTGYRLYKAAAFTCPYIYFFFLYIVE